MIPRLFLITEPSVQSLADTLTLLPDLVSAGVEAVQLRAKDLSSGELFLRACDFRKLIDPPALFLLNERVDIAVLCEADGVHLPESGLPEAAARRLLGRGRLIGRSVHSIAMAQSAEAEGCDYVIFGNVFETESKLGQKGCGLDALREVVRAVRIPVIAIGGITPERVAPVLSTGAHGVAVIRGVLAAPDPLAAVDNYRRVLGGG